MPTLAASLMGLSLAYPQPENYELAACDPPAVTKSEKLEFLCPSNQ